MVSQRLTTIVSGRAAYQHRSLPAVSLCLIVINKCIFESTKPYQSYIFVDLNPAVWYKWENFKQYRTIQ